MAGKRYVFSWGEWNSGHIAEHGIRPEEAEFLVEEAEPPFPRDIGDKKFLARGQSPRGRYLQVIYSFPADEDVDPTTLSPSDLAEFSSGRATVVFVLHARDLTEVEKRRFRKLR